MRAAYFVVTRDTFGRETPAIWWDELPQQPIRHLVYVTRLDHLANAAELTVTPLANLFALYQRLKVMGMLPARYEPPKRPPAPAAQTLLGIREHHPRRFIPDGPYDQNG